MTRYCDDHAPAYAFSIEKEYATCDFCDDNAQYATEDGSDTLGLSPSFSLEGDR